MRRVFFCYDPEHDRFRADQVRAAHLVPPSCQSGFVPPAAYDRARKGGRAALRKLVAAHLDGTSVTVLLIGSSTAESPWVRAAVAESVARDNGFVGIRVHGLLAPPRRAPQAPRELWLTSAAGPPPLLPVHVPCPVYTWDLNHGLLARAIEVAGLWSDMRRRPAPASRPA